MGNSPLNIPIAVRSNELKQVKEIVPQLIDRLEQAELPEAANEMARIYDEHISGIEPRANDEAFAAYLSMPPEDWRVLLRHLDRARRTEGKTRVEYLQKKLLSRVEERIDSLN